MFREYYPIVAVSCGGTFTEYLESVKAAEALPLDELTLHMYMRQAHYQRLNEE